MAASPYPPQEYLREPDYARSFSRMSFQPDNASTMRSFLSSNGSSKLGGIPEDTSVVYPKDAPQHRYRGSLTSNKSTFYDPSTPPPSLSRKKSIFPWQKKKQQEAEALEQHRLAVQQQRDMENQAERQRLERLFLEERTKREQFEAEQRLKQHQEDERRRLKEEARRKREAERQAHEDKRKREIELRRRTNTPDALRRLRELIRTRYELDMEIYRLKDVRAPDRPFVENKMQRADAVLAEIWAIVGTWEEDGEFWGKKEWELAVEVRERLFAEGKRFWVKNPPWSDD